MTCPVIVTGATGRVGGHVVDALRRGERGVIEVSHRDDLTAVPWKEAHHVVNCAAVTPGPTVTAADFWDGNVTWVERLLPHLDGRHLVHFGTVSALYRVDAYQVSKLAGENVLRLNAADLASVTVVPVPTLDDAALVDGLAARAEAGEQPTITAVRYAYCSPAEVARHVTEDVIGGAGGELRVQIRVLSDRVRDETDAPFVVGPTADRTARLDGRWSTTKEGRDSYLGQFA